MKVWLKGGLIGAIFYIVFELIRIIPIVAQNTKFIANIIYLELYQHLFSICFYLNKCSSETAECIVNSTSCFIILIPLFGLIIYFIIGALIGFLISKLKSKNKKETIIKK